MLPVLKKKIKYQVYKFLYPALLFNSKRDKHSPLLLANSMPKSGTHLLSRLVNLLPGMIRYPNESDIGPNEAILEWTKTEQKTAENFCKKIKNGIYANAHWFYFEEVPEILKQYGIKLITIIRDPRDNCISDYHFIMKEKSHRLNFYYQNMKTDHERLMASICGLSSNELNGAPASLNIGHHYKMFYGWVSASCGIVIKFEDLIGSKGGGCDDKQRKTVEKILSYLNMEISQSELDHILENLFFINSPTFRKGQINQWQNEFQKEHTQAFEEVAGDILDIFGYERS